MAQGTPTLSIINVCALERLRNTDLHGEKEEIAAPNRETSWLDLSGSFFLFREGLPCENFIVMHVNLFGSHFLSH